MACNYAITAFDNVQYDCNVAFGGIKGVKVAGRERGATSDTVIEIEFNASDAFSNASETKTVSPDGTISVAQTLQIELPRLDKDKYEAIKSFKNPSMELKVYVLTKSGKMITYGNTYGCYLSNIDVASGASRGDKNRIQMTFTGDEASLAPITDAGETAYNALTAKPAPEGGEEGVEIQMVEPMAAPVGRRRIVKEIYEDEQ